MLIECLKYVVTPCPFWVRRLGYLSESIGIDARANRQKKGWLPHLHHCHQVIKHSLDLCRNSGLNTKKDARKVLILGAGAGHDIPLHTMGIKKANLTLVDLVHPLRIRLKTRSLSCEKVTLDLTEIAHLLRKNTTKSQIWQQLNRPQTHFHNSIPPFDLIISLNVATQLSVIPTQWMQRHWGLSATEKADLRKLITQRHFDWIRGFQGIKCVITDHAYHLKDPHNQIIKKVDFFAGLNAPPTAHFTQEWQWELAPQGELPQGLHRTHFVRAWVGQQI